MKQEKLWTVDYTLTTDCSVHSFLYSLITGKSLRSLGALLNIGTAKDDKGPQIDEVY